ncbi:putrescine importer PuuP [Paenibacillus larvae subsp. larvae]|uniref:Putrescine importer PuuP n=1 Tax=Paenibacillus larvae subsp. larvae TaxID=147375 RepID=A0A2L1UJR4_9BACL|nr:APC family permease [Paenibacillus larvae]AQT84880.1 Putrescine importer PuuP [Paenibacillus larvae subsp. pulvifaciens]AQZ46879.1 Putrescine importer PuuP [Paenibacillus larvae subsp. pulvifaciens]AVF28646.1 putrescine importer PuuP [Paenibacillus larvae subsp. larvae]AVF33151.1 putrescine importer PuuP [Paenibacillus larvae subsp. larvae]MBH0343082.1 Putrescine importer PuuP [Paenibacillus larvae]
MDKQTQLKRTLTLAPVVLIGLAYMDPLVVFDSYGIVSHLTEGHVAASYITILVALLFTAYSYGKMVQAFPVAGSTYTYAQKSISPYVGFLVGWAVMLDYLFLPMVNFAIGAAYLTSAFPAIPGAIWVLILAVLITTINLLGIRLTANINTLLVSFQTLVALTFVGFSIQGLIRGMGEGTSLSPAPFFTPDMDFSLILGGASILCFSFLGFDAVTTLSEETINPRKTIPRAILLIALIGGILFTCTSYFLQLVYPDYSSFAEADSASLEIAQFVGGAFMHSFFLAGTMVAVCSSSLSSHASASRLLYAMGREGSLPKKVFGYVHPKLQTPVFNILFIGILSLTAMFGELEVIVSFISFGALVGFMFVNISVIAHYFIRNEYREGFDIVRFLIVPSVGALFSAWLFTSLNVHALMLGIGWLIVGIAYSFFTFRKEQTSRI